MNNVHGLNDFSNNNERRPSSNNQSAPLMANRFSSEGNPRQQGFLNFLKNFCCPNFTVKSFIFIITIIDIILYIVTLCFGVLPANLKTSKILAPKLDTLIKFGALVINYLNFRIKLW